MTEEIIWSRPLYYPIKCIECNSIVEFIPPAIIPQLVKVGCYICQAINTIEKEQLSYFEDTKFLFANGTASGGKRIRGTDESPLNTELYDLLGVSPTVTKAEIKKKYYALALKYYPNKCSDLNVEENFKKISEVYLILSDEKLRQKYNKFGPNSTTTPEGGFAEIELFIRQCFIGEQFVNIIGEIRLIHDIRNILINGEEENKSQLSAEEKKLKDKSDSEQRERELNERISTLVRNLIDKMSSYCEHESSDSEEKLRQKIIYEIDALRYENFGVELLHTIGNIYSVKAKHYLDTQKSHGIFKFAKKTGHIFTDTNSKLSEAYSVAKLEFQLLKIDISLKNADKNGICQSEKDKLKHEYDIKYLDYMWQNSRLEVMVVIRQVCDRILYDSVIPKSMVMSRARGLNIIGDLYSSCGPV